MTHVIRHSAAAFAAIIIAFATIVPVVTLPAAQTALAASLPIVA